MVKRGKGRSAGSKRLRNRFDFVFLNVAQELKRQVEIGLAEPSECPAIRGLSSATTAEICRTSLRIDLNGDKGANHGLRLSGF